MAKDKCALCTHSLAFVVVTPHYSTLHHTTHTTDHLSIAFERLRTLPTAATHYTTLRKASLRLLASHWGTTPHIHKLRSAWHAWVHRTAVHRLESMCDECSVVAEGWYFHLRRTQLKHVLSRSVLWCCVVWGSVVVERCEVTPSDKHVNQQHRTHHTPHSAGSHVGDGLTAHTHASGAFVVRGMSCGRMAPS